MSWRSISADQYRKMEDAGGYDEARIMDPATGQYRDCWDVGTDLSGGKVVIYTAGQCAMFVDPDYPIEVC